MQLGAGTRDRCYNGIRHRDSCDPGRTLGGLCQLTRGAVIVEECERRVH